MAPEFIVGVVVLLVIRAQTRLHFARHHHCGPQLLFKPLKLGDYDCNKKGGEGGAADQGLFS